MKLLRSLRKTALAAVIFPLSLAACSPTLPQFKATDITGSRIGGTFELPDHNGRTQRLTDQRGKLVIVSFGFTSCPDVCPTTLTTLAQALKQLGPNADKVQVFMITVDPARDTPQVLSQYVRSFDPRFIALVPSDDALKQVSAQFKVYINRNKPDAGGFYTVDHTAASYVFDGQGQIRLLVPHEMSSENIATDLRLLLAQGGKI